MTPPIHRLGRALVFPDPCQSHASGVLAVGGDLSCERLLLAYSQGIFPWYSEGQPILWHSPDPRMVLLPDALHVSRSLERALRRGDYEVRLDTAFSDVVHGCAEVPRPGQPGTWITPEMHAAYVELQQIVQAELPYISLYHLDNVAVMDARLEGVELHPSGFLDSLARAKFRE